MGSFACCVSGLPIHYGDAVKFLLLVSSPYSYKGNTCRIADNFLLRTFPLDARYDDYGSVKNVQKGHQQEIWFEGFNIDLIKRGVGDNICHDVAVDKNMNLDNLLEALFEGRILVDGDVDKNYNKILIPKGIPTVNRITKFMKENDLGTVNVRNSNAENNFAVSNIKLGIVKIRSMAYENCYKNLLALKNKLSIKYNVFFYVYKDIQFLIVFPKHIEEKEYPYIGRDIRKKMKLSVHQAMIRKDVWDRLLSIPICDAFDIPVELDNIKNNLRYLYKVFSEESQVSDFLKLYEIDSFLRKNRIDIIPFMVGLGTHLKLMFCKKLTKKELDKFINVVAETIYINTFLSNVRFQWRPGHSSGPQFGEWKEHYNFNKAIMEIAKKNGDNI